MDFAIPRNLQIASVCYFLSWLASAVLMIIPAFNGTKVDFVPTILALAALAGLGYLIRQNYAWFKWLFLLLVIIGVIGLYLQLTDTEPDTAIGIYVRCLCEFFKVLTCVFLFWPVKYADN
jgi:hypothetical protein